MQITPKYNKHFQHRHGHPTSCQEQAKKCHWNLLRYQVTSNTLIGILPKARGAFGWLACTSVFAPDPTVVMSNFPLTRPMLARATLLRLAPRPCAMQFAITISVHASPGSCCCRWIRRGVCLIVSQRCRLCRTRFTIHACPCMQYL